MHCGKKKREEKIEFFLNFSCRPRRLSVPGSYLSGVYVVRAPEDANSVAAAAEGKKVVVVGTSFIGK